MNYRLTKEQKIKMHEFWAQGKEQCKDKKLTQFINNKIKKCKIFKHRNVDYKTIKRWTKKWKKGGFTAKENRSYTKKPRKIKPGIQLQIKQQLILCPSLRQAANKNYTQANSKEKITVSRSAVHVCRKKHLGISKLKINKFILTDHHKKMRKKFANIHAVNGSKMSMYQVKLDLVAG